MGDTLEAIIVWAIIFAVILVGIYIYTFNKVKKNLINYRDYDCNKGRSDEEIIKKEVGDEVKVASLVLGIIFLLIIGVLTCTNGLFEKKPQPKIENYYEGSKGQQEDIDFANELIEDINKNK